MGWGKGLQDLPPCFDLRSIETGLNLFAGQLFRLPPGLRSGGGDFRRTDSRARCRERGNPAELFRVLLILEVVPTPQTALRARRGSAGAARAAAGTVGPTAPLPMRLEWREGNSDVREQTKVINTAERSQEQ